MKDQELLEGSQATPITTTRPETSMAEPVTMQGEVAKASEGLEPIPEENVVSLASFLQKDKSLRIQKETVGVIKASNVNTYNRMMGNIIRAKNASEVAGYSNHYLPTASQEVIDEAKEDQAKVYDERAKESYKTMQEFRQARSEVFNEIDNNIMVAGLELVYGSVDYMANYENFLVNAVGNQMGLGLVAQSGIASAPLKAVVKGVTGAHVASVWDIKSTAENVKLSQQRELESEEALDIYKNRLVSSLLTTGAIYGGKWALGKAFGNFFKGSTNNQARLSGAYGKEDPNFSNFAKSKGFTDSNTANVSKFIMDRPEVQNVAKNKGVIITPDSSIIGGAKNAIEAFENAREGNANVVNQERFANEVKKDDSPILLGYNAEKDPFVHDNGPKLILSESVLTPTVEPDPSIAKPVKPNRADFVQETDTYFPIDQIKNSSTKRFNTNIPIEGKIARGMGKLKTVISVGEENDGKSYIYINKLNPETGTYAKDKTEKIPFDEATFKTLKKASAEEGFLDADSVNIEIVTKPNGTIKLEYRHTGSKQEGIVEFKNVRELNKFMKEKYPQMEPTYKAQDYNAEAYDTAFKDYVSKMEASQQRKPEVKPQPEKVEEKGDYIIKSYPYRQGTVEVEVPKLVLTSEERNSTYLRLTRTDMNSRVIFTDPDGNKVVMFGEEKAKFGYFGVAKQEAYSQLADWLLGAGRELEDLDQIAEAKAMRTTGDPKNAKIDTNKNYLLNSFITDWYDGKVATMYSNLAREKWLMIDSIVKGNGFRSGQHLIDSFTPTELTTSFILGRDLVPDSVEKLSAEQLEGIQKFGKIISIIGKEHEAKTQRSHKTYYVDAYDDITRLKTKLFEFGEDGLPKLKATPGTILEKGPTYAKIYALTNKHLADIPEYTKFQDLDLNDSADIWMTLASIEDGPSMAGMGMDLLLENNKINSTDLSFMESYEMLTKGDGKTLVEPRNFIKAYNAMLKDYPNMDDAGKQAFNRIQTALADNTVLPPHVDLQEGVEMETPMTVLDWFESVEDNQILTKSKRTELLKNSIIEMRDYIDSVNEFNESWNPELAGLEAKGKDINALSKAYTKVEKYIQALEGDRDISRTLKSKAVQDLANDLVKINEEYHLGLTNEDIDLVRGALNSEGYAEFKAKRTELEQNVKDKYNEARASVNTYMEQSSGDIAQVKNITKDYIDQVNKKYAEKIQAMKDESKMFKAPEVAVAEIDEYKARDQYDEDIQKIEAENAQLKADWEASNLRGDTKLQDLENQAKAVQDDIRSDILENLQKNGKPFGTGQPALAMREGEFSFGGVVIDDEFPATVLTTANQKKEMLQEMISAVKEKLSKEELIDMGFQTDKEISDEILKNFRTLDSEYLSEFNLKDTDLDSNKFDSAEMNLFLENIIQNNKDAYGKKYKTQLEAIQKIGSEWENIKAGKGAEAPADLPYLNYTQMSNVDEAIQSPDGLTRRGSKVEVRYMTPDEYIEHCAKGFGKTKEELESQRSRNKAYEGEGFLVDQYAKNMKDGDKFPMPYLEDATVSKYRKPGIYELTDDLDAKEIKVDFDKEDLYTFNNLKYALDRYSGEEIDWEASLPDSFANVAEFTNKIAEIQTKAMEQLPYEVGEFLEAQGMTYSETKELARKVVEGATFEELGIDVSGANEFVQANAEAYKYILPEIEIKDDKFSQEGLHRAIASKKLGMEYIPVAVERGVDQDFKGYGISKEEFAKQSTPLPEPIPEPQYKDIPDFDINNYPQFKKEPWAWAQDKEILYKAPKDYDVDYTKHNDRDFSKGNLLDQLKRDLNLPEGLKIGKDVKLVGGVDKAQIKDIRQTGEGNNAQITKVSRKWITTEGGHADLEFMVDGKKIYVSATLDEGKWQGDFYVVGAPPRGVKGDAGNIKNMTAEKRAKVADIKEKSAGKIGAIKELGEALKELDKTLKDSSKSLKDLDKIDNVLKQAEYIQGLQKEIYGQDYEALNLDNFPEVVKEYFDLEDFKVTQAKNLKQFAGKFKEGFEQKKLASQKFQQEFYTGRIKDLKNSWRDLRKTINTDTNAVPRMLEDGKIQDLVQDIKDILDEIGEKNVNTQVLDSIIDRYTRLVDAVDRGGDNPVLKSASASKRRTVVDSRSRMQMAKLGLGINKEHFLKDRGWFKGETVDKTKNYEMDQIEDIRQMTPEVLEQTFNSDYIEVLDALYNKVKAEGIKLNVLDENGDEIPMDINKFAYWYHRFLSDMNKTKRVTDMFDPEKKLELGNLVPFFETQDDFLKFMTLDDPSIGRTGYIKDNSQFIENYFVNEIKNQAEQIVFGSSAMGMMRNITTHPMLKDAMKQVNGDYVTKSGQLLKGIQTKLSHRAEGYGNITRAEEDNEGVRARKILSGIIKVYLSRSGAKEAVTNSYHSLFRSSDVLGTKQYLAHAPLSFARGVANSVVDILDFRKTMDYVGLLGRIVDNEKIVSMADKAFKPVELFPSENSLLDSELGLDKMMLQASYQNKGLVERNIDAVEHWAMQNQQKSDWSRKSGSYITADLVLKEFASGNPLRDESLYRFKMAGIAIKDIPTYREMIKDLSDAKVNPYDFDAVLQFLGEGKEAEALKLTTLTNNVVAENFRAGRAKDVDGARPKSFMEESLMAFRGFVVNQGTEDLLKLKYKKTPNGVPIPRIDYSRDGFMETAKQTANSSILGGAHFIGGGLGTLLSANMLRAVMGGVAGWTTLAVAYSKFKTAWEKAKEDGWYHMVPWIIDVLIDGAGQSTLGVYGSGGNIVVDGFTDMKRFGMNMTATIARMSDVSPEVTQALTGMSPEEIDMLNYTHQIATRNAVLRFTGLSVPLKGVFDTDFYFNADPRDRERYVQSMYTNFRERNKGDVELIKNYEKSLNKIFHFVDGLRDGNPEVVSKFNKIYHEEMEGALKDNTMALHDGMNVVLGSAVATGDITPEEFISLREDIADKSGFNVIWSEDVPKEVQDLGNNIADFIGAESKADNIDIKRLTLNMANEGKTPTEIKNALTDGQGYAVDKFAEGKKALSPEEKKLMKFFTKEFDLPEDRVRRAVVQGLNFDQMMEEFEEAITAKLATEETAPEQIKEGTYYKFTGNSEKNAKANQIYAIAKPIAEEFGIDIRQLMAQWALESAWGTSGTGSLAKAKSANAIFGIKAMGWTGKTVELPTSEEVTYEEYNKTWKAKGFKIVGSVNGKVKIQGVEKFRAYDSMEEAVRDYASLIQRKYPTLNSLRKYATDSSYVPSIQRLMKQFGTSETYENEYASEQWVDSGMAPGVATLGDPNWREKVEQGLPVDSVDYGVQSQVEGAPGTTLPEPAPTTEKPVESVQEIVASSKEPKDLGVEGEFAESMETPEIIPQEEEVEQPTEEAIEKAIEIPEPSTERIEELGKPTEGALKDELESKLVNLLSNKQILPANMDEVEATAFKDITLGDLVPKELASIIEGPEPLPAYGTKAELDNISLGLTPEDLGLLMDTPVDAPKAKEINKFLAEGTLDQAVEKLKALKQFSGAKIENVKKGLAFAKEMYAKIVSGKEKSPEAEEVANNVAMTIAKTMIETQEKYKDSPKEMGKAIASKMQDIKEGFKFATDIYKSIMESTNKDMEVAPGAVDVSKEVAEQVIALGEKHEVAVKDVVEAVKEAITSAPDVNVLGVLQASQKATPEEVKEMIKLPQETEAILTPKEASDIPEEVTPPGLLSIPSTSLETPQAEYNFESGDTFESEPDLAGYATLDEKYAKDRESFFTDNRTSVADYKNLLAEDPATAKEKLFEQIRKGDNHVLHEEIAEMLLKDITIHPTAQKAIEELKKKPRSGDPRIKDYLKAVGLGNMPATTSWCASFVSYVAEQAGMSVGKTAGALKFAELNKQKVELEDTKSGDVLIFRNSPTTYNGHVNIVVHNDGKYLITVGGNQTDPSVPYEIGVVNYKIYDIQDIKKYKDVRARRLSKK